MNSITIPIERWAALMEERAELLAFKLRVLESRPIQAGGHPMAKFPGDLMVENFMDSPLHLKALQGRVRAALGAAAMSQAAFAKALGVAATDLSLFLAPIEKWKALPRRPSKRAVERFCEKFPASQEERA